MERRHRAVPAPARFGVYGISSDHAHEGRIGYVSYAAVNLANEGTLFEGGGGGEVADADAAVAVVTGDRLVDRRGSVAAGLVAWHEVEGRGTQVGPVHGGGGPTQNVQGFGLIEGGFKVFGGKSGKWTKRCPEVSRRLPPPPTNSRRRAPSLASASSNAPVPHGTVRSGPLNRGDDGVVSTDCTGEGDGVCDVGGGPAQGGDLVPRLVASLAMAPPRCPVAPMMATLVARSRFG
jgi:hypothetical protein